MEAGVCYIGRFLSLPSTSQGAGSQAASSTAFPSRWTDCLEPSRHSADFVGTGSTITASSAVRSAAAGSSWVESPVGFSLGLGLCAGFSGDPKPGKEEELKRPLNGPLAKETKPEVGAVSEVRAVIGAMAAPDWSRLWEDICATKEGEPNIFKANEMIKNKMKKSAGESGSEHLSCKSLNWGNKIFKRKQTGLWWPVRDANEKDE